MSKYLVTLTPTGRFFFGGDTTFEIGNDMEDASNKAASQTNSDEKSTVETERKKHNEKFSSYIIHSSKFPQQTSLLGMLRFLLLAGKENTIFDRNSQKVVDKNEAKLLIGEKSFCVNSDHAQNSFGKIQYISPCFLHNSDSNTNYFKAPADYQLTAGNFDDKVESAMLNGKEIKIPVIIQKDNKAYCSKHYLSQQYLTINNGKVETIEQNEIFQEDSRIGIRKNESGKAEEKAFYKQIGYKMSNPAIGFAFITDVLEIDLTKYSGKLVSIGADSSMFVFKACKLSESETLCTTFPDANYQYVHNDEWEKVVLLSDTYLEEGDLENVCYAISESKPFRFLSFEIEDDDYNVMRTINKRSKRYNLYKAGSVFFLNAGKADDFKNKIDAKAEFVQIGYNKYISKV